MIRARKEIKCWARQQRKELTGWSGKASETADSYIES